MCFELGVDPASSGEADNFQSRKSQSIFFLLVTDRETVVFGLSLDAGN